MNYRLIANSTYRKLIINIILHLTKFIGSLLNITFEALSYSSGFDSDIFAKSHLVPQPGIVLKHSGAVLIDCPDDSP